MKRSLFTISILLLAVLPNCRKHSIASFEPYRPNQVIAIQPIDNFPEGTLVVISKEIGKFYKKKVIVLKGIQLPNSFFSPAREAVCADSILNLLSLIATDRFAEIIGITHHSIYTVRESNDRPYFDEAIFGMGYQPGNSCIVSDKRLSSPDASVLNHRIRNVIIHEIGHNAGLPHCNDNNCIMSKMNGYFSTLDNGSNNYCTACENKLNR